MTRKERERLKVVEQVDHGHLTYAEGALHLGISERQLYRSVSQYRSDGDEGLVHQLRGTHSNRRHKLKDRLRVIELHKEERYKDYGPTLFRERLEEKYGIRMGVETIRQLLLHAGTWKKARKGCRHRKKRPRRSCRGELIQFDGSPHRWFEDRGPECCLLVAVDDATGRCMLRFAETESTQSVLTFWKEYFERYGLPRDMYIDHGSVYYHVGGPEKKTDFGHAMAELEIGCIYAFSPQAKGRVERMNRTLQDWLLKDLREYNISTIAEGNRFIREKFEDRFNAKRPRPLGLAADVVDVHRACGYSSEKLSEILSYRQERSVYNDWTITLEGQWLQLTSTKAPLPPARSKVQLRRYLNGELHIFWQGNELGYTVFGKSWKKPPRPKHLIPPADHPWLRAVPIGKAKRKTRPD